MGLAWRRYAWYKLTGGRIRWLEADDPRLVEPALEVVEEYMSGRL